ncbi:hypothetical protein [Pseudoalteromonas rubra]|uniref:Uncharacterized protein n=1 Tax=Pseudoalteromonas rubra TaxID=43658 RepID=A0A5S3X0S4_9GAMM|nr:hypothetical protein [Pseudoalteromonas rubra]TMP37233.1 hypothetical protein CWB98_10900 [Pseudoalteromonas rubra]
MEINEQLYSLSIEFDELRNVGEQEHESGFKNGFKKAFNLAKSKFLIDESESVELASKGSLGLKSITKEEVVKNQFTYHMNIDELYKNINCVSLALYKSEIFEVRLRIFGKGRAISVIICADPVYFYFEQQ